MRPDTVRVARRAAWVLVLSWAVAVAAVFAMLWGMRALMGLWR